MPPLPTSHDVLLASDFGGMVRDALWSFAAIGAVALLLGAGTSAFLVAVTNRKWVWWMSPLFAALWLALIALFLQVVYGRIPV